MIKHYTNVQILYNYYFTTTTTPTSGTCLTSPASYTELLQFRLVFQKKNLW